MFLLFFFCLVQWSKSEHFVPEVGEFVMCDVREKEYTIPDLNKVMATFSFPIFLFPSLFLSLTQTPLKFNLISFH